MKKPFLPILLLVSLSFAISIAFISCGGGQEHEHTDHEEAAHKHDNDSEMTHACPMHPEIKGKKGDNCSKCDMSLEVISVK